MRSKAFIRTTSLLALLLALSLIVYAGCRTSDNQGGRRPEPPTAGNPTLSGRPSWAMPKEWSEDQKIAEMKAHLEAISAREPDTEMLGVIFLRRAISLDEYDDWSSRYGLLNGEYAGYHATYPGVLSAKLFDEVELEPRLPTGAQLHDLVTARARRLGDLAPNEDTDVMLESLAVYSTTSAMLRLWNEHADAIRTIGVAGRRGEAMMLGWFPMGPQEPMP